MAATTAAASAALGFVVLAPAALSSSSAFKASSVQFAPVRPMSGVHRVVSPRASLSEEQSVTRRDVLANILGAGVALGFAGQALANPGSLARPRRAERSNPRFEYKSEAKPEAAKITASEVIEAPAPSPPKVPTAPEEPKVSNLLEAIRVPELPSISEVPHSPELHSLPDLPTIPEVPAPKAEEPAPSYADDFGDIGQYFKDLF